MRSQIEQVINQMMLGPPEIFVVTVQYCDGTYGFYTFDEESYQMNWVEQLAMNARGWNIERICYGESMLNFIDSNQEMFTIH